MIFTANLAKPHMGDERNASAGGKVRRARERRKNVLVLYYTRGVYPMRDTIRTHLYSLRRYSGHNVYYVNVIFGFPDWIVRDLRIDVVVYHTIFLSMRWAPAIFREFTDKTRALDDLRCVKIALPQDEFIHTDMLAEFLGRTRITHVLSAAGPEDWPKIYRKLDRSRVQFRTVLTGYLDEETVRRIERLKARVIERTIDIGYRAWRAAFWLGEHGMHKVWVAERFQEAANRRGGLKTDISLRDEDTFHGDDWFEFLLRCRTTVGVEGGSSVIDYDGTIKARVESYLAEHPDADFFAVRAACFPDQDHTLGLVAPSPRHLEACATETCQVLIESPFHGILEAGKHYIPVKPDYSNVDEVLDQIQNEALVRRIAADAYRHVVESGRWTYRGFVDEICKDIIDPATVVPYPSGRLASAFAALRLRILDWIHWRVIQFETSAWHSRLRALRDKMR